jgi:hypothetical protein
MIRGGEHPHLNCIQIVWHITYQRPVFRENEAKPYVARLIWENRAKTVTCDLAKL